MVAARKMSNQARWIRGHSSHLPVKKSNNFIFMFSENVANVTRRSPPCPLWPPIVQLNSHHNQYLAKTRPGRCSSLKDYICCTLTADRVRCLHPR